MSKLATIRTIRTRNFTIRVDTLEESDLDLSFDDTGEIQSGLESGRLVAFCARVTVYLHGAKVA